MPLRHFTVSIIFLATQLNSTSGDIASDDVLKASASSALTKIVADSTLVQSAPTTAKKSQLTASLEQAVDGITDKISPTGIVVESPTLLAEIETVLETANIEDTVSITLSMGGGRSLNFGAIITKIEMRWIANSLVLKADISDDDLSSIEYEWATTSSDFSVTNQNKPTAQIFDFQGSSLQVSLSTTDTAAGGFIDNASCTWQTNPTVCEF